MNQTIEEKIKQRRAQMLIHSCIYYELNSSIVSDHKWQQWAEELYVLQKQNPDKCEIGFFDWDFFDWDGTTGNHLPYRERWVYNKAKQLLEYSTKTNV